VVVLPDPVGPGDQEDAVGAADDAVEDLEVVGLEAQVFQADLDRIGAQNTQHHALAVVGRAGRDAEVDVHIVHTQLDAPVLGHAALGDVHPGHELDAGEQRVLHPLGKVVALHAHTVDAVAQADTVLHGLDVDIRGPHLYSLGDDAVAQPDDRGIFRDHVDRLVQRPVHGPVHGLVDRLGHQ
jgi:hypothetical protein